MLSRRSRHSDDASAYAAPRLSGSSGGKENPLALRYRKAATVGRLAIAGSTLEAIQAFRGGSMSARNARSSLRAAVSAERAIFR